MARSSSLKVTVVRDPRADEAVGATVRMALKSPGSRTLTFWAHVDDPYGLDGESRQTFKIIWRIAGQTGDDSESVFFLPWDDPGPPYKPPEDRLAEPFKSARAFLLAGVRGHAGTARLLGRSAAVDSFVAEVVAEERRVRMVYHLRAALEFSEPDSALSWMRERVVQSVMDS